MGYRVTFWRVITSRLFLAVAVLALAAISYGMFKTVSRQRQVAREVAALQQDISSYHAKQQNLQNLLDYFTTPEYSEREARLKLGLQKPGEQVVVIPGLGLKAKASGQTAETEPNWRQWLRYFLGG